MRPVLLILLVNLFFERGTSAAEAPAKTTGPDTPAEALLASTTVVTTPTPIAAVEKDNTTTTTSTTPATEKAVPKKPTLSLISKIPTFDFSKKNADPPPKVVENTCNKKDVCIQGLCMHGSCMTKPCSTEIVCICKEGFTGQFCDKNLTDGQVLTTVANGNTETSTSPSVKDKQHVNGHVNDNVATLNNGVAKIGNDTTMSGESGNVYSPENVNTTGDNATETSNNMKTSAENKGATKIDGVVPDKKASASKQAVDDNKAKPEVAADAKNSAILGTQSDSKLTDGSYVKGPEAFVPNDNSTLQFRANVREIKENTPSVIRRKAEVVTTSTTAVRYPQFWMTKEIQNAHTGMAITTAADKSQNKENVVKTNKNGLIKHKESVQLNKGVASHETVQIPKESVDIAPLFANSEIKITIETTDQGVAAGPNNVLEQPQTGQDTQRGAAVTGDIGTVIPKEGQTQGLGRQEAENTKRERVLLGTGNIVTGNLMDNKQKVEQPLPRTDSTSGSGSATLTKPSQNNEKGNIMGANRRSDIQQTTKSEALSPFLQLMNIFGSDKFVENVSAVKIEIITKNNNTHLAESNANIVKKGTSNNDTKRASIDTLKNLRNSDSKSGK